MIDVTHSGGRGICQKVMLLHKHFVKCVTRGKGGVKNLKIWVMSFMDRPFGSEKSKKPKRKNIRKKNLT